MPVEATSTGLDDLAPLGDRELPAWLNDAMSMPRREGSVDVDGATIRWRAWGDPDDPGIVLFHGFMAHSRVFSAVAPVLAHGRHVVAFDLSGMGDSGWRSSYSELIRAREAWAVVRDAGLLGGRRPPVLVSHSFGSAVAMRVVEEHPGEVGGLCLCDMMMLPPEVLEPYMAGASLPTTAPPRKVRPTLDAALARFRLQPEQPTVDELMVDLVARHAVTRVGADAAAAAVDDATQAGVGGGAEASRTDGWAWKFDPQIQVDDMHDAAWWGEQVPRFARLDVPRAVLHGELSAVMPPVAVDHVRASVPPDVPVVAVPYAHHHLMLDQPLAFVAAVRALIARW